MGGGFLYQDGGAAVKGLKKGGSIPPFFYLPLMKQIFGVELAWFVSVRYRVVSGVCVGHLNLKGRSRSLAFILTLTAPLNSNSV